MRKNNEKIVEMIDRYLIGECTREEAQIINSYFNEMTDKMPEGVFVNDIEQHKREIWKRMKLNSNTGNVNRMVRYAAAAAIFLLISGVALFYTIQQKESSDIVKSVITDTNTDIKPGGYGAKLTMANGSSILLDSTKSGVILGKVFTYEDGSPVQITNGNISSAPTFFTASTVRGQTYSFTLSDGSKVWLNTESKLTFPSHFIDNRRKVTLEGEAYFVVQHQPNNSFFVESNGQLVEDLGTEFNIQAYSDEAQVKTTLIDGSIKVNNTLIEPGEQTILSSLGNMGVEKVDIDKVLAWKNGDFVFRGESLEEVLRIAARWYDIDVEFTHEASKKITVGCNLSRSKSIRTMLNLMEQTEKIKFKLTGRVLTVL